MNRINFISWGGRGNYGRLKRALLLASSLRRTYQVSFLTLCRGKTTAFLIDSGFPFSFFEGKYPAAELFVFDVSERPENCPEDSIFIDLEGEEGIKMLPLRENGKNQIIYPRFRHFHLLEKKYRNKGKKVLVAPSSLSNMEEVEEAIERVEQEGLFPIFAPHFEFPKNLLSELRKRHRRLRVLGTVNDLARAFWEADMALISGRVRPYEAATVGTPAVYLREDPISREFVNEGAGLMYKEGMLKDLYFDPYRRETMGKRGKELVDGLGLKRALGIIRRSF